MVKIRILLIAVKIASQQSHSDFFGSYMFFFFLHRCIYENFMSQIFTWTLIRENFCENWYLQQDAKGNSDCFTYMRLYMYVRMIPTFRFSKLMAPV